MVSKLEALFKQTFGARKIMGWARQLGAVVRLRRIHPEMFCLSLVACALGDETRSIATARRFFARLSGFSPEESSFYDRFTEAMVALLRYMYRSALSVCTTVHRAQLAAVLGRAGLADMLAIDSTQILLPASAKDSLPSTDADRGGVKLTTTLSLLYQTVDGVVCTSAKTHDRKALKIGRWLHEQLLIFDRGYSDHKLFAQIIARKGFFLTRL